MAICILIIISLCLAIDYSEAKCKKTYWVIGTVLVILLTFSDRKQYPDYNEYLDAYKYGSERIEFTYSIISNFAKELKSFKIVLFMYASLAVLLKLYVFKKITSRYWACLALYLSYFYLLHELIQIRAGVASAFLLLAYYYFSIEKLKKCLMALVIGSCFHYSAIVGILIFGINTIKYDRKKYVLMLISFLLIGSMGFLVLPDFISSLSVLNYYLHYSGDNYIDEHGGINLLNIQQLIRYGIYLLIMYKSNYIQCSIQNLKLFNIYFLGSIVLCILSIVPAIAFRAADMIYPIEIVVIPNLIIRLYQKKHGYNIIHCVTYRNIYIYYVFINLIISLFVSHYLLL